MIHLFARTIIPLFIFFVLVIAILSYKPSVHEQLDNFLDSADTCTTKPCFLGIVPGETEALRVSSVLRRSDFIGELDIVDIVTGLEYLNWEWTGTQAPFFSEAGYLRYRSDTVSYLTLKPDLRLRYMRAYFGKPDAINENNYYIRFYYFERGLILRFLPNCDSIWESETWIDIDIRITAPIEEVVTFSEAVNSLCGKKQSWP
jgi:hypothetical protein